MTTNKPITTLYEHYKNTPKKLKIICDWDEVIQSCEAWALQKAISEMKNLDISAINRKEILNAFKNTLDCFWSKNNCPIEYSSYGSKITGGKWVKEEDGGETFFNNLSTETIEKQIQIKNSPFFYQQAPFLTIAEDLLKLIKEDKVEQLIFLSAYDKRKFPNGDERKVDIFTETFGNFGAEFSVSKCDGRFMRWGKAVEPNPIVKEISLHLIGFDNETQGQTKADWIKQNAADFDLVIDDNPNICKKIIETKEEESADWERHGDECMGCSDCWDPEIPKWTVLAPYYPAIENQHHSEVLLVKNEVSSLKKEDFSK